MIDASHEDFETNIARTKKLVQKAHAVNVSVEAELGVLSRIYKKLPKGHESEFYTKPEEVVEFVERTGCDSLAIAVGTSHGAYKFSGNEGIQFEILKKIKKKLPGFPLVLHGASSINQKDVKRINRAGGALKPGAQGVKKKELSASTEYGICKVNIATDFRLLWTRVQREFMMDWPEKFAPTVPGSIYMKEYKEAMIKKFALLNATKQYSSLKESLISV